MHDRREQVLRGCCLALAALLAFQFARALVRGNPAKRLVIPALPSLPPEPGAQTTNSAAANLPKIIGTNTGGPKISSKTTTNPPVSGKAAKLAGTNTVSAEAPERNVSRAVPGSQSGDSPSTSGAPGSVGSILLSGVMTEKPETNSPSKPPKNIGGPSSNHAGTAKKGPDMPPEVKARVERITQSEILGQVIRPMPMALLGIAGQTAFLRSPDGQTGLVKEGGQVGTIKLLRIGTNRVLIELDGQNKELTMFAGIGGETLLPKDAPKTNEITKNPN